MESTTHEPHGVDDSLKRHKAAEKEQCVTNVTISHFDLDLSPDGQFPKVTCGRIAVGPLIFYSKINKVHYTDAHYRCAGGGKTMRGKACERAEFSLISHEMFRRRALPALSRQPGTVQKNGSKDTRISSKTVVYYIRLRTGHEAMAC